MPSVLLAATRPLEEELRRTVLFRRGVERHRAQSLEEAQLLAVAAHPELVLVDRDLPRAETLVQHLRANATTRGVSIGIVARGELDAAEVGLIAAGANAVLRLPADAGWDRRLVRLMSVPLRRDARLPVHLRLFQALAGPGDGVGLALNLSLHGMLVEANVPLRLHDRIAFAFRLCETDTDKVSGSGNVVRQAGAQRFGVEFERLDYAGAARIQRFVATLPA